MLILTVLACIVAAWVLAYVGAPLFAWTLAVGGLIGGLYGAGAMGTTGLAVALAIFAPLALVLNLPPLRQRLITAFIFGPFKAVLPCRPPSARRSRPATSGGRPRCSAAGPSGTSCWISRTRS
jgi:hypothetical protein